MVAKESKTGLVVAGLLLGLLMAAMDNTIVSASMPTIVGDLGGLDQFIWVTSAYLVATMASMPIFGKLSDMFGRKRFYLLGLAVFLIGSALCGTSQSMVQLIVYRAIQGIGGGSLMPIAFTIIYDIYPPEKRGKMVGLFGAVFGLSSVMGPLLGAFITDQINWRWVFYINLPFGVVSLFFIAQFYRENLQLKKLKIDWFGALTLVGSVVSLMLTLELGGRQYAWTSAPITALFFIFAVMFVLFIWIERKVQEPIISFSLFRRQLFAATQGVAFFYNGAFIIITVLIPLFVQAVYGGTATNAGVILIPLMVGSAVGAQVAGQIVKKFSYRGIMLVSVVIFFSGMLLLGTIDVHTARSVLTVYMVIAGLGMGCSFSMTSLATQHNLEPQQRGIATSTNTFFRTLGTTLGVTVLGTIQNHIYNSLLAGHVDSRAILSAEAREKLSPEMVHQMTDAMSISISAAFYWALLPIGLGFICIVFMGKARIVPLQKDQRRTQTS
ncbi:MDR family MFS transporter [Paenibacillus thalictri]|uniref:DHA2 family efflux MFS transporter permease subunit n=1 Tax=Paenibacillus thalictri TaxID=2527873 RepID=A0A4Q9DN62_9BACL|nr:MDR family MFS transporter [Paenibacillus thalictri]TBL77335.1 DHA2 family efflux MFS transporter permease subunit [Paenibacillus thalictri]